MFKYDGLPPFHKLFWKAPPILFGLLLLLPPIILFEFDMDELEDGFANKFAILIAQASTLIGPLLFC
jgi:hypothetical protein